MSWIQRLYETYENNISIIGKYESDDYLPLLPVFHTYLKANFEVTIDGEGNIIRASYLGEKVQPVMAPITEESSGRSGSKPYPHPLVDKIQYLAGDYEKFGGTKYFGYDLFNSNLKDWADSEFSTDKIKAINKYINKGSLIEDLIKNKVIFLNTDNKIEIIWNGNTAKLDLDKIVVKWNVEIPGVLESRIGMDKEAQKSWINYYSSKEKIDGYCQVIGKRTSLAKNHPKNIYNLCANAKIISSNDNEGFTYRGRFNIENQAYGVSKEASQKAHNALRWLIGKQGYNIENQSIILWSPGGKSIVDVFKNTFDIFGNSNLESLELEEGYVADDLAHKLKLKLAGYSANFNMGDNIVVMGLESVTDGRFSIIYYQELSHEEFYRRIGEWHESCKWLFIGFIKNNKISNQNKKVRYLGAPAPIEIAKTIYGDSKSNNQKLLMKTVERILPCIINGQRIPLDIVEMAFHRAVMRESFDEDWKYEKSLAVACSLYKKYLYDYKKEEIDMALDPNRNSRDYLYGRLLAVAENVESWALNKAGEKRLTNAERLMQRFADHPYTTWKTIELSLRPYFARLQGKGKAREILIDEIMDLFDPDEFMKDSRLNGEFLLGFHNQREFFNNVMAESKLQNNNIDDGGEEYVE